MIGGIRYTDSHSTRGAVRWMQDPVNTMNGATWWWNKFNPEIAKAEIQDPAACLETTVKVVKADVLIGTP